MPSMRSAVCGLILCGIAALAAAADKPVPSEKRFALPASESLVIQWGAGWADIAPPPQTGDDGNLRILARNIARELENSGGEAAADNALTALKSVRIQ